MQMLRDEIKDCAIGIRFPIDTLDAPFGYGDLGVQGPMARSVADCALFLDTTSGFDPRYPLSFPVHPTPYLDAVARGIPRGCASATCPTCPARVWWTPQCATT